MPKTKLGNETPKFYEMDGALRAYANRSIVLAGIMGIVALIAVARLFVRQDATSYRHPRRERWSGKRSESPPRRSQPLPSGRFEG